MTQKKVDPKVAFEMLRTYDPALYATWGSSLERAVEPNEVDVRSRTVIVSCLDGIIHWALPIAEQHIHDAFNAGATIGELIEASLYVGEHEGGSHGLHDAFEALEMVVRAREKAGLPTPLGGAGLGPQEMVPEAPWPVPPVFPMHSPSPRYHLEAMELYYPELAAEYNEWQAARFRMRRDLTRRMEELLAIAVDTAIFWPEPFIDHHMHAAFEAGVTAQEIVEVIVLTAGAVQGVLATNIAARRMEGGAHAMRHGLLALDRVLSQREDKGLLAPRDKMKPKTGKVALTR